jgi:aquaporin Z
MRVDIATGPTHADLSVEFSHHSHGESRMTKQDRKVASAELVGTFFLALFICASKNNMNPSSHPFAIGLGLTCLIYALGPISGGQFNPAVTLGLWARNKVNSFECGYCIIAQVVGAVLATVVCFVMYGAEWSNVAAPSISTSDQWRAFVAEYVQTLALVVTVLNTATTVVQGNNSYFGLAIGFVVVAGALTVGGISGGCFNPAIAIVSFILGHYMDALIYILAQVLAGISAAILFRAMNPAEWDDSDPLARLTHSHHNPEGNVARALAMLSNEFFGTMMLVYTVALSSNALNGNGFLAIGSILAAMIYMGGSVSGAHYNPAVSIGVYVKSSATRGDMRLTDCLFYILAQVAGAFLGGKLAHFVNGGEITGPSINFAAGRNVTDALLAEVLFSFLLVMVVLCVACTSKVAGNSYFGLAIGFAVLAGASSVGDVSGAALNPAVGIALSVLRGSSEDVWVYIVGPIIGGVLATLTFLQWSGEEESA